ncbi:MAG: hypothetical protein ABI142_02130, partial [Bryocella sp.]
MRFPYPERISYSWATLAAAILFLVQILQGTSPLWAMFCFCFIVLAVTGVNLGGGLYRATGAFIFFSATLMLVIGVLGKAVLGEAADSNLQAPMHLIEAYTLGMAAMCFAAFIEHAVRPKDSLLTLWFPVTSLRNLFVGVITAGIVLDSVWVVGVSYSPGSILSALRYASDLISFGVVLGVMYCVRSSNGRRSLNAFLIVVIVLMTVQGLLQSTKQGLFLGPFCWMLGAGASRFRLRPVHLITFAATLFVLLYYCVPIVQSNKSTGLGSTYAESFSRLANEFLNIKELRKEAAGVGEYDYGPVNYYNQSEGFLDRLQMIGIDDLLIAETDRDGYFGYLPTIEGFQNLIPHFIWRNKPTPYFGNGYAHELSLLDDNDYSTGVSFSPTADAYKQGGFVGIG